MTQFIDGPAAGVTLMLRRAPHFLRAVCGSLGAWDALDQLGDRPQDTETITVYELVGEPTWCHIRMRTGGGIFRGGRYRVVDPQPAEHILRHESSYREWAQFQFNKRGLNGQDRET